MREKILEQKKSVWVFILIIALSIFFETSVTTLPLIVGTFVLFAVILQRDWVFVAAFLSGLIFDILTLRTIGTTSIFLIVLIFTIFLYKNKFEIETIPFVFIACFFASFIFLITAGFSNLLLPAFIVSIFASVLFRLLSAPLRGKIR
ncbi:MAG: hypothetical protein HYU48_02415 [Candidatus Levybacteria bacterium]|nr:hypothetical protein [Candidatus Levybacteria bacterium]